MYQCEYLTRGVGTIKEALNEMPAFAGIKKTRSDFPEKKFGFISLYGPCSSNGDFFQY